MKRVKHGKDRIYIWDGNPQYFELGEQVTSTDILALIYDIIEQDNLKIFNTEYIAKKLGINKVSTGKYLSTMARKYNILTPLRKGYWKLNEGEYEYVEREMDYDKE